MTEPTPPTPEDSSATAGLDSTSPLRGFITEVHEIYLELLYVGFDRNAAAQIAAHMLGDAVSNRGGYDSEDDDFDDDIEIDLGDEEGDDTLDF